MNSKRKGNGAELELLHLLHDRGYPVYRNDQRYIPGGVRGTENKLLGRTAECFIYNDIGDEVASATVNVYQDENIRNVLND